MFIHIGSISMQRITVPQSLCARPASRAAYSCTSLSAFSTSRRTGFQPVRARRGLNLTRAFNNTSASSDQPNLALDINKAAAQEPIAFLGGLFAGFLGLNIKQDPLQDWIQQTSADIQTNGTGPMTLSQPQEDSIYRPSATQRTAAALREQAAET